MSTMMARGELTFAQIVQLDGLLVHHGYAPSSPHTIDPLVAWVCLGCGSICAANDVAQRDAYVKQMIDEDRMPCEGPVVHFHSTHTVLVDPTNLNWGARVTVIP